MSKGKKKGSLGTSNKDISPSTNLNVSTIETYRFQDLPSEIRHFAEHGIITLLPLKPGTKEPKLSKWKTYQTRQYPLNALKRHKGNFGVITGSTGKGWSNLVILDIDDKKGPEGLYRHFKDLDTLQVKTASKGYHLYFWSNKPVEDHNYIGKLFNLDIELRGKRKIYCVLPPSSVYYPDTDFVGGHEVIKMGGKYPLMELDDPEEFIKDILLEAGYKIQRQITKEHDTPPAPILSDGTWEHNLTSEQVTRLVEYLKPLYKEGQRQDLALYLSGWFYKAEVSPETALEVITHLSNGDSEQRQRILALKNTYRGGMALKGSGGVWELLEDHYTNKHLGVKDKAEKEDKIGNDTREHYGKLAKIIIHPLSMEGIRFTLKGSGVYKETALRELIRFVKNRYNPIVDNADEEVYIYDYNGGYYKGYGEKRFKQWIDTLFPEYEFFLKDTNKVKTAISNIMEENEEYLWFENGLLNTHTLEFEDHTPEVFTKKRIHYNYNPEAQSEFMETKLKEILIDKEGDYAGEENKYLFFLQWIGYCFLNGNPFHTMLFITGGGGNGKSVLSALIYHIFDYLVASVPLHDFYSEFGKMGLVGKNINVVYDLPKKMLKDTGELKAITGEDNMTIPIKNKPPWTGKLPVKIIGMGNHLPKVTDASDGFWQRIAHFKTRNKFRGTENEDKDLKNKLKEDMEGIEWLIHQSIKAYKEGPHIHGRTGWALPIGTDQTKTEYLRLSNPCYYGALELFEKTNDRHDMVERTDVVKAITELLRNEELEIPAHNGVFYQAIRNLGGEDDDTSTSKEGRKRTLHVFRMIKFKETEKSSEYKPIEFDNNTTFELDNAKLDEYGPKNLNPPEKAIIGELRGYGSNKYSDMINSIEIDYTHTKEEINIGLKDLIDNGIISEKTEG